MMPLQAKFVAPFSKKSRKNFGVGLGVIETVCTFAPASVIRGLRRWEVGGNGSGERKIKVAKGLEMVDEW